MLIDNSLRIWIYSQKFAFPVAKHSKTNLRGTYVVDTVVTSKNFKTFKFKKL